MVQVHETHTGGGHPASIDRAFPAIMTPTTAIVRENFVAEPGAPSISGTAIGKAVQSIRYPWVLFTLLSFVFIGGDILAVRAGGITLRFVALPILGALAIDLLQRG